MKPTYMYEDFSSSRSRCGQNVIFVRSSFTVKRSGAIKSRYAARYGVNIHGWCLMHNHGHFIFEASSKDSISNLKRDMQSCYSRYLNKKYRAAPWLLMAPLAIYGRRN